jgi:hypothetical protein
MPWRNQEAQKLNCTGSSGSGMFTIGTILENFHAVGKIPEVIEVFKI